MSLIISYCFLQAAPLPDYYRFITSRFGGLRHDVVLAERWLFFMLSSAHSFFCSVQQSCIFGRRRRWREVHRSPLHSFSNHSASHNGKLVCRIHFLYLRMLTYSWQSCCIHRSGKRDHSRFSPDYYLVISTFRHFGTLSVSFEELPRRINHINFD